MSEYSDEIFEEFEDEYENSGQQPDPEPTVSYFAPTGNTTGIPTRPETSATLNESQPTHSSSSSKPSIFSNPFQASQPIVATSGKAIYSNPFDQQATAKPNQIKFEPNKKEINKYEYEKFDDIMVRRRRDIPLIAKMQVDTNNDIFTQNGLTLFERYQQKLANGTIKNQLLDTKDNNQTKKIETDKMKMIEKGINVPNKSHQSEFNSIAYESLNYSQKEKLSSFCGKYNNVVNCVLNENILKFKNFYKTIDIPEYEENNQNEEDEEEIKKPNFYKAEFINKFTISNEIVKGYLKIYKKRSEPEIPNGYKMNYKIIKQKPFDDESVIMYMEGEDNINLISIWKFTYAAEKTNLQLSKLLKSDSKVVDLILPSKNNRLLITHCRDRTINVYDTNQLQPKSNPFRIPITSSYTYTSLNDLLDLNDYTSKTLSRMVSDMATTPFEELLETPLDPVYGMFEDENGHICLTDISGTVLVYDVKLKSTGNIKMHLINKFKLVYIIRPIKSNYVRSVLKINDTYIYSLNDKVYKYDSMEDNTFELVDYIQSFSQKIIAYLPEMYFLNSLLWLWSRSFQGQNILDVRVDPLYSQYIYILFSNCIIAYNIYKDRQYKYEIATDLKEQGMNVRLGNFAVCVKSDEERLLTILLNEYGAFLFKVELSIDKISKKELKYQIEKGYII